MVREHHVDSETLERVWRVFGSEKGELFQQIEEVEPCRKRNPERNPALRIYRHGQTENQLELI